MSTITHRTLLAGLTASVAIAASSGVAHAGDGTFGPGQVVRSAYAESLAVGDFDDDGRPDVAAVRGSGVTIDLRADGGGFTPAPDVSIGGDPDQVVVADFNADGHDDLAVTAIAADAVRVRLGKGDGTFADALDVPLWPVPRDVVVGDFNADGREDLAISVVDARNNAVAIAVGGGNGIFSDWGFAKVAAAPLAVGDFDSDGIEDIAYGRTGSTGPAGGVLKGVGGGVFDPRAQIELRGTANSARSWAVADFDRDGHQDLVAAADLVGVRFGAGDGTFAAGLDIRAGDNPWTPAVGDFDGDGDEDFAVTDYYGTTASVHLGDGRGGFSPAPAVAIGAAPSDLAVADFDGDGNDDLVVASSGGVTVHAGRGTAPLAGNLLVNGGFEGAGATGLFTAAPPIPGWERSGGMTYARYGIPSHAYFPSRLAAPRYGGGGSLLWGGSSAATGGVTEAFQDVDVSAAAASIDAGLATARLSAYLGGALGYADRMRARAEFADAAGRPLGAFDVGPVTAADRRQLTTLLRRAGSAPVPAGTRTVRVRLTSIDDDRSYSSATADNVKLTLDAPAPPTLPAPPVLPGPPSGPDGGGASGGAAGGTTSGPGRRPAPDREAPAIGPVALEPASFRSRGGTTIRLALSEPAALALTVQRVQRGRRVGRACRPGRGGRVCQRIVELGTLRRTGRAGANRFAFDGRVAGRPLRPGAYRLTVTATDPSGNRATARPVGFRIVRGGR